MMARMDLQTEIATHVPRRICDTVFHSHHEDLRCFLNVHCIHPLLNTRQLLSPSLDQSILTSPTLTTEQRVDIVLSWLPKSSLSDYLTPFIQCLEESSGQAGEGHVELVASMRAQVQREMENYDEGNEDIYTFEDAERDGPSSGQIQETEHLLRVSHFHKCSAKKKIVTTICTICSIILLLISIVWIIITVLFLNVVPKNVSERSLSVPGGEPNVTILVSDNLQLFESVTVAFTSHNSDCLCDGQVAVIEGDNCSNLPTFTKSYPDCQTHITQTNINVYALKNSSINFTAVEIDRTSHVWITGTEDARQQLSPGDLLCSSYPLDPESDSDIYCFTLWPNHTSEHFLVSKPGFYHARTYSTSGKGIVIDWSCELKNYNFTAIKKMANVFTSQWASNMVTATVSHSFNFTRSCALLNYNCDTGDCGTYTISISHVKHRWDIVVLIFIIYFCCVVLSVFFVITSVFLCFKRVKCRK